jgi:hypothetical protein
MLKKLKIVSGIMLVVLFAFSTSLMAQTYSGGSGTEPDPYHIANKADLKYLSENSGEWSKHFKQTAHISFVATDFQNGGDFYNSGAGFSPIGNNTVKFTGSYNGQTNTISNLYINRDGEDWVGFFGYAYGANISNIGLLNENIVGCFWVGGLVGENENLTTNTNCYTTGTIEGEEYIGGLVGENYSYSIITNCYSTCSVTGEMDFVGGLVGRMSCVLVMIAPSVPSTISDSYATGEVEGVSFVGGLVGANYNFSKVLGCHATGNVSGEDTVGGLVGRNSSLIDNCYSTGEVSGNDNIGGLVGSSSYIENPLPNSSCTPSLSNSHSISPVNGFNYIGGLVGGNGETDIINCCSGGSVDGYFFVGGLIGSIGGSDVNTCFSNSTVTGIADKVGGLFGSTSFSFIDYCYATGSVYGQSYIGGMVGLGGSSCYWSFCYSSGFVGGACNYVGGFAGSAEGSAQSLFWDTQSSGTTNGNGCITVDDLVVTGFTTDQMKTQSTYTNAGWDFTTIWEMIGYNYPTLRNNPPTLPVTLSSFTAQFLENTPTLYWSTQSETDNMGWFVYRNDENNFTTSNNISDFIDGHGTTTQQQTYRYEDDIQNPIPGDVYYYWLESIDYGGQVNHYDKAAILTIPDHHDPNHGLIPVPQQFGLLQNEPNPCISSTKISFNLTETAGVELSIYNLKGQLVKKLYSGIASSKTVEWDGKDANDKALENGVYFYNLIVNGKTAETKKLILMK